MVDDNGQVMPLDLAATVVRACADVRPASSDELDAGDEVVTASDLGLVANRLVGYWDLPDFKVAGQWGSHSSRSRTDRRLSSSRFRHASGRTNPPTGRSPTQFSQPTQNVSAPDHDGVLDHLQRKQPTEVGVRKAPSAAMACSTRRVISALTKATSGSSRPCMGLMLIA